MNECIESKESKFAKTNEIRKWWAARANTREFRDAVEKLQSVGGNDKDQKRTLHHFIVACYEAVHYDPEKDPHVQRRKKLKMSRENVAELREAANVLGKSLERKDPALSWALILAETESGVRITRQHHIGEANAEKVAARYFAALVKALDDGSIPELNGGPFIHLVTSGNLIFPEHVSSGRKGDVDIVTMLAFELEFRMRLHTAGRAQDNPQPGEPMPSDGAPCRYVIEAWINAALPPSEDQELNDGRRIQDRIRKLPKTTGLIGFPRGGMLPEK